MADRCNHLVQRLLVPCHRRDAGPMAGQTKRTGTTDTGRGARDQDDLVVKRVHKAIVNSAAAIGGFARPANSAISARQDIPLVNSATYAVFSANRRSGGQTKLV